MTAPGPSFTDASAISETYETLLLDLDGDGVLTVTLNRPDMLNAYSLAMSKELVRMLDAADADDAVRALVFTGAGRGYCAGMDLGPPGNVFGLDETIDPWGPEAHTIRDEGGLLALRLFRMKKPVIAAVNGPAVGVGATMTLPMDGRILSKKARIGFVFSKIGICMEGASSWFL
ncbi:MAG: enoyl-CoA hydratase-related protein, partial [Pseudomonadota bacterium]